MTRSNAVCFCVSKCSTYSYLWHLSRACFITYLYLLTFVSCVYVLRFCCCCVCLCVFTRARFVCYGPRAASWCNTSRTISVTTNHSSSPTSEASPCPRACRFTSRAPWQVSLTTLLFGARKVGPAARYCIVSSSKKKQFFCFRGWRPSYSARFTSKFSNFGFEGSANNLLCAALSPLVLR